MPDQARTNGDGDRRVLTVVIPALDEEAAIGETVRRCLDAREAIVAGCDLSAVEVIVVSDGSTDRTESIAAAYDDVTVLAFEENRGYGAALKCGFAHGRGELVSFLDADGTCDPLDLIRLVGALDTEAADVVLGSRMGEDSEMPAVRRIGNTLFAWMLGLLSRRRVGDTASGMRVIRRAALEHLYPLPDGLHFTPAMSARVLLEGRLKLVEVPIPYAERVGRSKLSVARDGLRFLGSITRAAMCYRPARPLLLLAAAFGALGFVVGAMPAGYWLAYGRLEEWMIYRILLASLLATLSASTICVAVVADRIATVAHGRSAPSGSVTSRLNAFFRSRWRWAGAGATFAAAVVVVWQGIVQYMSTGVVTMHWSRPVLASLLAVVMGMLVLTALLVELMELIVDQRAGGARIRPPDRVRHGTRADPLPTAAPAFDAHAEEYEADCMRGLAASGEDRAYFARGRAGHLAAWWAGGSRESPATIVDFGCGTGEGTVHLAAAFPGARVVGLDVSGASIALARQRHADARIEFETIDGPAPVVPEADLIHLSGVLHHVAPTARDGLLAHLASRLRRGGALAVFENNPLNPGTRWVMSRIPFDRDAITLTPWEATGRLRGHGLLVEHRASLFWFPRALRILRPLEPWLEPIPLGAQYVVIATRP